MKHRFFSGNKEVTFETQLVHGSFGDHYRFEIKSSSTQEAVGKSDCGYNTLSSAIKAALIASGLLGAIILLGVILNDVYSWC